MKEKKYHKDYEMKDKRRYGDSDEYEIKENRQRHQKAYQWDDAYPFDNKKAEQLIYIGDELDK